MDEEGGMEGQGLKNRETEKKSCQNEMNESPNSTMNQASLTSLVWFDMCD